MKINELTLQQLDNQLKPWVQAKTWFQPKLGWIRTIRKALGITTKQLAAKLEVSRTRIIKIESDELNGVLTMQTLSKVAEALNCDFVFSFIPKEPLSTIIEKQATKIAAMKIKRVAHNMLLENQSLMEKQNKIQIAELKDRLLKKSLKKIWNEK